MKCSDALPSASKSLQAEVGAKECSAVPAYNPGIGEDKEGQLFRTVDRKTKTLGKAHHTARGAGEPECLKKGAFRDSNSQCKR
jgi:hypothetical protein